MKTGSENTTGFLFRWRMLIAVLFALAIIILQGCKKDGPAPSQSLYEKYFEENVLNRDFKVSLATDNGTNITAQYNGWIFKLFKGTFYGGPMTAIKAGVTYNGTWASNDDYGKLTIQINQPSVPAGFDFLNREWRFTKKDLPTMELAPWGSNAPVVLHMQRQ